MLLLKKPFTKETKQLCTFALHWFITVHNILYYIYTRIRVRAACVCVKTCGIQQDINSNAGRIIVVATVARYGFYDSEFEPREVEIFRAGSGKPRGPPSLLQSAHRVSFHGVKRSGRGVDYPPPSTAGVTQKFLISLAGIVGSNATGGVEVCLLWVLCVARSLRRADQSSRGVLPSVVCLSVIVKPRKWGDRGPKGAVAQWKKIRGNKKQRKDNRGFNTLRIGHLNCLNPRSRALNTVIQLLYFISLKIHNKFADD
jgi:hypothetical protein